MSTTDQLPLAAVVLAHAANEFDALQLRAMVSAAHDIGAATVVAVVPRGFVAPANARVAQVNEGVATISALRAGMALLTNTTARLALVWPLVTRGEELGTEALRALVDAARREGAAVTALAGRDLDDSPVIVARGAWLELITSGEQGIAAVATRHGGVLVSDDADV